MSWSVSSLFCQRNLASQAARHYETGQIPMFELLGTAPEHKKHYVTPRAHLVPRDILIRETLDWFDKYLD